MTAIGSFTRRNLSLALILLVSALVLPHWPPAALADTAPCGPFYNGTWTCYAPSQLAEAEGTMPITPLSPISTVTRVANLPLTGVTITEAALRAGRSLLVNGIHYVFGDLPRGIDCSAPFNGNWAVVDEIVGHNDSLQGVQLGSACRPLSPSWDLSANLPDRNLTLHIDSNLPRAMVQGIGLGLLGAATAVALGNPLAPAHMTRRQAIRVAMAYIGRQVFRHPFTVRYGRLAEARGSVDVWAIRVKHLSPPMHAALIVIDDTTGTIFRTEEY